jgi:hypothetical protein
MLQTMDMIAIRAILDADPVWSAYGLADLQPAFRDYCRWYPVQTDSGDGLALIFTALDPPVLLTVGQSEAVAAALRQADLPPTMILTRSALCSGWRCRWGSAIDRFLLPIENA